MNPRDFDLKALYLDVERLLSGISPDSFLILFFSIIFFGIFFYVIGYSINLIFRLLVTGLFLLGAYLIFQYGDSIPFLVSLHGSLRGLYPNFPSLRILVPALLVLLAVFSLYQAIRGND